MFDFEETKPRFGITYRPIDLMLDIAIVLIFIAVPIAGIVSAHHKEPYVNQVLTAPDRDIAYQQCTDQFIKNTKTVCDTVLKDRYRLDAATTPKSQMKQLEVACNAKLDNQWCRQMIMDELNARKAIDQIKAKIGNNSEEGE